MSSNCFKLGKIYIRFKWQQHTVHRLNINTGKIKNFIFKHHSFFNAFFQHCYNVPLILVNKYQIRKYLMCASWFWYHSDPKARNCYYFITLLAYNSKITIWTKIWSCCCQKSFWCEVIDFIHNLNKPWYFLTSE